MKDAKGNDDGNDDKGSGFSGKIIRACDYSSTNRAYVAMTVTAMCGLLVVLVLTQKSKKSRDIRTVLVQLSRMSSRHQTSIQWYLMKKRTQTLQRNCIANVLQKRLKS